MSLRDSSPVYRYSLALVITAITLLLALSVEPFIHSPFLLPIVAVMAIGWGLGLKPALVSAGLMLIAGNWLLATSFATFQFGAWDGFRLLLMVSGAVATDALAERRVRHTLLPAGTEQPFRPVLDSLPAPIAILDWGGKIITTNGAWRRLMEQHGITSPAGDSYLSLCNRIFDGEDSYAERAVEGLQALVGEESDQFAIEYPRDDGEPQRWYRMNAYRLPERQPAAIVVMHEDISERRAAAALRQQASRHLRWREEILRAISSGGPAEAICKQCTDVLTRRLDLLSAQIWLVDGTTGELVPGSITGTGDRHVAASYPIDRIQRDRAPVQIDHLHDDPAFTRPAWASGTESLAFTGRPLLIGSRLVGVLALFTHHPLDGETRKILRPVSVTIAHGIARKRSEDERSQLRMDLQQLLASTGEGIYGIDTAGRCTFVNRAAAEMLGYRQEELTGRNMHAMIHHSQPDGTPYPEEACPVLQTLRLGTGCRIDNEVMWRRDGTALPVAYSSYPIIDDGTVRGAVVTFNDTSERRRDEQIQNLLLETSSVLATSLDQERSLDQVARAAVPLLADACAIYLIDGAGKLERAATAEVSTGDQAIERALRQAHPSVPPPAHPVMRSTRSGSHTEQQAAPLPDRPDGTIVTFVVAPLEARGECLGALSLATSSEGVADRVPEVAVAEELARRAAIAVDNRRLYVEAEAAAGRERARAKQLRGLTDASLLLNATLSHEMILDILTERARRLVGADHAITFLRPDGAPDSLSDHVAQAGKPSLADSVLEPMGRLVDACLGEHSDPIRLTETALQQVASRTIPAPVEPEPLLGESLTAPLSGRDGQRLGIIHLSNRQAGHFTPADEGILLQLTRLASVAIENLHLYQQTERALHARDQFIAAASHELKTPITSLVGYADLLKRRSRHDESLDERTIRGLNIIHREANRLTRLIDALLDSSRIQTGQPLTLDRKAVDLRDLVAKDVERVRQTLENHSIVLHLPDSAQFVEGDTLRLQQVFESLLQNAIKFSPDGGRIDITVVREANEVCLAITDSGLGIPEESLAELFSRYHRGGNVEARGLAGLGLGLHLSRHIVRAHGGTIHVTSTEGIGSTFTVRLPRHPGSAREGD